MGYDEQLNASEVAGILHIGRNAVYALAKSGELPSFRIGRKLFFTPGGIDEFLAARKAQGNVQGKGAACAACAGQTGAHGAVGGDAGRDAAGAGMGDAGASDGAGDGFVLAGDVLAADLFAGELAEAGAPARRLHRTSYDALLCLYGDAAHAAFSHLYDHRSNSYNVPYVQRLVPGLPLVVMRVASRMRGFVVARGNPKGIESWGALLKEGVRLANREKGCGARVLLDQQLLALEASGRLVEGYAGCYASGRLAAEMVASGRADVAIGTRAHAEDDERLAFVPMQREWIDVAIVKTEATRALVREMKRIAADGGFARRLAAAGECATDNLGAIVYEC